MVGGFLVWLKMAAARGQAPGSGTTQGDETTGDALRRAALASPVGFRGRSLGGHQGDGLGGSTGQSETETSGRAYRSFLQKLHRVLVMSVVSMETLVGGQQGLIETLT